MPPCPTRRLALLGAASALLAAGCAQAAPDRTLTVYKTPWCGCCGAWIDHMAKAGFKATIVERQDLAPVRAQFGVPDALQSCHTARVGGYVLEGHVPAADVLRLLKDGPKAVGLAVPGMPAGSPGMETPDGRKDRFQTLLIRDRAGATAVFAAHG